MNQITLTCGSVAGLLIKNNNYRVFSLFYFVANIMSGSKNRRKYIR